jgi:hypothetical protein
MMLQFREWLFVENTVSQLLKADKDQEGVAKILAMVKPLVRNYLPSTRQMPEDKVTPLYKLFTYWIVLMKNKPAQPGQDPNFKTEWNEAMVGNMVRMFTRNTGDYISHLLQEQPAQARSKFNNPQYVLSNMTQESEQWHEKIAQQKRKGADPGRRVEIAGMPAGHYWVSLDRPSCDKEAEAMGHCGNAGYKEGDIVWSMRDPKGVPHLTFIVNKKMLGESKGFANNKPEAKYHPHIIAFLLGEDNGESIVEYVKGGGYKPEANFHLEDLDKATQDMLKAKKPQLFDYFTHLKNEAGGDEKKWKEAIDTAFNFEFSRVDVPNQQVVVKEFGDITQMIEWLKENTHSKLGEIPDFDDMSSHDFNVDTDDAVRSYEYSADKKTQVLMDQVIKIIEDQHNEENPKDEDDDEDRDLDWAVEVNDDLATCLRWAADDAYRVGSEGEAYKHVTDFFKKEHDEDGNGFVTDATYGGGWHIVIGLKELEALFRTKDDPEEWDSSYDDLPSHITYNYSQPYNGYNEFDDSAFNERLQELLHEHFPDLKEEPAEA